MWIAPRPELNIAVSFSDLEIKIQAVLVVPISAQEERRGRHPHVDARCQKRLRTDLHRDRDEFIK
ncbi:MAG: hypothetical protein U0176_17640 [Bacteroidia bacterium]